MEKLKYPEKQYQEILEEMSSRAARTQGFYQYVAGLSQLVIDERMLATEAKKVYLFLAWDSPANASCKFFSVCVPVYLFVAISFTSIF